jgi:hypothetical protein
MEAAHSPNANAIYQQLRTQGPSGESFSVHEVTLKRDAGVFTLHDGTVSLYPAVNGRETGAVFVGSGSLHVDPATAAERHQLKMVMKTESFDQSFSTAVFAFTDGTAAELRKQAGAAAPAAKDANGAASEMTKLFRNDLKYNLEARLLEDVLPGRQGGFFVANMKGPLFSKRIVYIVDPEGAMGTAPDEVAVLTSYTGGYDVALGFHAANTAVDGKMPYSIPVQDVQTKIEYSGALNGQAETRVVARKDGMQVVRLSLFPKLRVSGVWGPKGDALDFIQEDKNQDADFVVILPQALKTGESYDLTAKYGGKDAVTSVGDTTYYLQGAARESWYPNMPGRLDNYADYHLVFRIPKDLNVVATGTRMSEHSEGKLLVSEWQTQIPIAVAGFNIGKFKSDISENKEMKVQVQSFANTETGSSGIGVISTTGMLKPATSQGEAAVQIYTMYFGPIEYDHIALTQQPDCTYGQSWPMLVYLPACYFYDSTNKHLMGLDSITGDTTYWKVVLPHEVAHQWWGQTVGFGSYRDQWMSEGFADFSASLYLMYTNKNMDEYKEFWKKEKEKLLTPNRMGVRPVESGPVTMGGRVNTSRSGDDIYQHLIYPKGAYILHMLQMIYWTPDQQEKPFQQAMTAFVNEYRERSATTEDFKASLEKSLPPWVDVMGNKKLDWFFDEYVYGTQIPRYSIKSDFTQAAGKWSVHVVLTQSGVDNSFVMLVPIYLELQDKRVVRLLTAGMQGTHTLDQTLNLGELPGTPKRLLLNYNYDVLSMEN